jgi:hypothetical protein
VPFSWNLGNLSFVEPSGLLQACNGTALPFYHPGTVYLREQGCEDSWLCFHSQKGSASKKLWETLAYCCDVTVLICVLIPAVRVVQSTRPPYYVLVTVQESMCRSEGGFMLVSINESCRHTTDLVANQ